MAKFRNETNEPLYFGGVGIVGPGQASPEVPDEKLYSYTASANASPLGKASQAIHDKAAAAEAEAVAAEEAERVALTAAQTGEAAEEPAPVDA